MVKLLLGLIVFTMSVGVFAADKSGGCGLGWAVTKKHSLVASTTRGTTNSLFGNQTFGMTSGTSGCARHSIVKAEKKGIHFVEANYDNLAVEMVQGEGEYLQAFARTLGCQDMVFSEFAGMTKGNFDSILPKNGRMPVQMLNNVQGLIQVDPVLAKNCNTQVI